MSRDSRAWKLLSSLYRGVLVRQRQGSAARRMTATSDAGRLEPLEPRLLMNGDPLNLVATLPGQIDQPGAATVVPFELDADDFNTSRGVVALGFNVQGIDGLDPAAASLQFNGTSVPLFHAADDEFGSTASHIVAELAPGSYELYIHSEGNDTGAFEVDVLFLGDLNGDGAVTFAQDYFGMFGLLRSGTYALEADANRDGYYNAFDTTMVARNLNASTTLQVLEVTADFAPGAIVNGATNVAQQQVVGNTLPGAEVSLDTDGDGVADATTTADGSGDFTFNTTLNEGDNTFTVTARDDFGQAASSALSLTLDSTAPPLTLELDPLSDSDPVGDGQTTDANVTLLGQTEASAEVTLRRGDASGDVIDVTTADATGAYSFAGVALNLGTNSFTATTADAVGNASSASLEVERISGDTEGPTISAGLVNDTGRADAPASFSDRITSDGRLAGQISDASPIDAVRVGVDGAGLVDVTSDPALAGDGSFLLDDAFFTRLLGSPLSDGEHTIAIEAEDAFGNVSQPFAFTYTIDTTPPAPPAPHLDAASDSGASDSDNITNDDTPTFNGAVEADSTVELFEGTNKLGGVTTPTGDYEITTDALVDGTFDFTVVVTDIAGNTGISDTTKVTIDTMAPPLSVTLDAGSDTGTPGDNITTAETLTLIGTTEPGLPVELFEGGSPLDSAMADGSGNYTVTATNVSIGEHTFELRTTDIAGNDASESLTVTREAGPVAQLAEQTDFQTVHEQPIIVPDSPGTLLVTFDDLFFDPSDDFVNDAFEIALVGANGRSLVHTIAPGSSGHEAAYSITQGQSPRMGINTQLDGQTVKIDLTHIAPGTAATLIARLINNDADTQTRVTITDVEVVEDGGLGTPVGSGLLGSSLSETVAINDAGLSDVSASVKAVFGNTSWNSSRSLLHVDVGVEHMGGYAVGGTVLLVIDNLSDPTVDVTNADGQTSDGRPYFLLRVFGAGDAFTSGESLGPRRVTFRNPTNDAFDFDVAVLGELNREPAITSTPELEVVVGQTYEYAVEADDPNGDALAFALLSAPDGMSIDPTSGLITFAPASGDVGNHAVSFQVSDGRGGKATQSFTLAVRENVPNRPPVIVSTPIVDARVDDQYAYDVNASDVDGDDLIFTLLDGPDGMSIDPSSGLLTWAPTGDQVDSHAVTVQVSDGEASATQSFNVAVQQAAGNHPPIIITTPTTTFTLPGIASPAQGDVDPIEIDLDLTPDQIALLQDISITLPDDADDAGFADIVVTVDQSGSMLGEFAFIPEMVVRLNAALEARGIGPNRFALGGFSRGGIPLGGKGHIFGLEDFNPVDIDVYDQDGHFVDTITFLESELYTKPTVDFTLPRDGAFTFVVKQNNSSHGLDFDRDVEVVADTAVTVTGLHEVQSGNLAQGETSDFELSLNAGMMLFIDEVIGGTVAEITVVDPTGEVLLDGERLTGDKFVRTTRSGVHTITMDNPTSSERSFGYRVLDADATVVSKDSSQAGTLGPNEAMVFAFEGTAGDLMRFDSTGAAGTQWGLFDSEGVRVLSSLSGYENITRSIEEVLETNGTHYLVVSSSSDTEDRDFAFDMRQASITVTQIDLGETFSGAITAFGDRVYFAFEGTVGQRVFYDGFGGLRPEIITPGGDGIGLIDADTLDFFTPITLTEAGTHYVLLDPSGDGLDSFTGRLLDVDAEVTTLTLDNDVAGTFAEGKETHLFTFDGSASQLIFIDGVDGTDGEFSLYDPFGNRIDQGQVRFDGGAILPHDGEYLLAIQGRGDDGDGYAFRVVTPQDASIPLTLGSVVTGSIAEPGDRFYYTFDTTPGQVLIYDGLFSGTASSQLDGTVVSPTGDVFATGVSRSAHIDIGPIVVTEDGPYQVKIDGEGDFLGDFGFRVVDMSTSPLLNIGGNHAATLTNGRGMDLFRFDGVAGQTLSFTSNSSSGNGRLIVFAPDGDELADHSLSSDFTVVLEQAGEHYVAVFGQENTVDGAGTVSYDFDVADITPAPVVHVGFGTTFSGTILAGDTQVFNLTASAGTQTIYDALQDGMPSGLRFTLSAPSGDTIINNRAASELRDAFDVLPETGTYTITLNNTTGGDVPFAFQFMDRDDAATLTLDVATAGTIDPGLGMRMFSFDGTAGDRVVFVNNGNDTDGSWGLIEPDGTRATFFDGLNDDLSFTLESTGRHTLLLRGDNDAGPVAFDFTAVTADTTVTPIALDTVVNGELLEPGQLDVYTFNAIAGDLLYLDGLTSDDRFGIERRIYDPDGTLIDASDVIADERILIERTGTYRIEVFGGGTDDLGAYSFEIETVAGLSALPFDTPQNITLSNGDEAVGFVFEGVVGQRLFFDRTAGSGLGSVLFYGPDGDLFESRSNFSSDIEMSLDATGQYHLVIQGRNSGGAASIDFSVVTPTTSTTALSFGEVVAETIGEPGEIDVYTFTGSAGQQLLVDTLATDMAYQFDLFDDLNRHVLDSSITAGAGEFDPYTLQRDGEYRLVIDHSDDGVGSYSFRLNDIDAAPVVSDQLVGGLLNDDAVEVFRFVGSAGDELLFYDDRAFGTADEIATLAADVFSRAGGFGNEDGYDGIRAAVELEAEFRPGAARNVIMVSDEDRDLLNVDLNFAGMLALLEDSGALLNVLVDANFFDGDGNVAIGADAEGRSFLADGSGGFTIDDESSVSGGFGTTIVDYVNLAFANGGAAFDLKQLRAGGDLADSFANAFLEVKSDEILEQVGKLDIIASDSGVTFENLTGVLSGIGAGDSASFDVHITGDGVNRTFDLLFVRPATGAIVGSIPVTISSDYRYHLDAIDPDGDPLTFELVNGPAGATIDSTSGDLVFDPDTIGTFTIELLVKDNRGGTATQVFDLTVGSGLPNGEPKIESTAPAQAVVGLPFVYDVNASDPNGDALRYFLTDSPTGMSINIDTGLINWTPQAFQLGTANVGVRVIDGRGGEATQSFALNVVEDAANQSPVFVTAPPTNVEVGQTLRYDADATDPDSDPLTYDLALRPDGMSVDADSGLVVWTPMADQFGLHKVILRVRDGRGGFALQSFDINVPGENSAPVITSTPPTEAVTTLPYQYQVAAQDAEGDGLTFAVASDLANLLIDGSDGLITFTADGGQVGNHEVTVTVRDARGAETSQVFTLSVTDINDNEAPVIESSPRDAVALGRTYAYQVEATDGDGDQLTYSLDEAPTGMTIDSDGLILWTPVAGQFGGNDVTVRVSDGRGGETTQSFSVDVRSQQTNSAPVIISTPPANALVGETYEYNVEATDSDNDALLFTVTTAPGGVSIDPLTGALRWTPTLAQLGLQQIVVTATDAQGAGTTQSFGVSVTVNNVAPTITSTPPTVAAPSLGYVYHATAVDPASGSGGDALTWCLPTSPAGMAVDPTSGLITWLPDASQQGNQTVELRVESSAGGSATQQFTIVVEALAPNDPPTITTTPVFLAKQDETYTYDVDAIDPEDDDLVFSLDGAPTGMSINPTTGLIEWTPDGGQVGPSAVKVLATDTVGNASFQSFTVTVVAANSNAAPQINSAPPSNTAANGLVYAYDVLVGDADGDELIFTLTEAPDGMTIDAQGRLRWTPDDGQLGGHNVAIRVSDPLGAFASQSFTLNVVEDVAAPLVQVIVEQNPVDPGTTVDIEVLATDNVAIASVDVTFNGTPLALDDNGFATVTPTTTGQFDIVATAIDTSGNSASDTLTLNVTDTSDVEAPFVFIDTPAPGDVIGTFTDVIGTVQDDNLAFYTLSIAAQGSGDFVTIASGSANVDGDLLGVFDPTVLANGTYELRLLAEDLGGLQSSDVIAIDVAGNLKLGNFRTTFVDLSIPLSGIPIQIARTYDTLQANQQGEFGHGWRLEIADADLRTNLPTRGQQGDFVFEAFKPGTRVYVTLPGGQREGFTFQPVPDGNLGAFLGIFVPRFVPDAGVTSTLTVQEEKLRFNPDLGEWQSYVGLLPYNPASPAFGGGYTLTRDDGVAFNIDGVSGDVTSVEDTNGNVLEYTEAGIFSNTGKSVAFERDAEGRITAVIDPNGKRVEYRYDANGDLVSVIDRELNETKFEYRSDRPHFLDKVIDPLGREGLRNEYDDDGRLIRNILGDGSEVQIAHDLDNQLETITDRDGNPTTYEYDERGNIVTIIDALGGITTRTYDADNRPLTETNAVGETTTFTYDSNDNILTETNGLGHTTTFTYDDLGNVLSQTDPLGNTTLHEYDSRGNRTKTIDALGNATTFEYDDRGNQISMTDALGHTTTFEYDAFGNKTREVDALGNASTFTYDSSNNRLSETKQRTVGGVLTEVTTLFTYDNNGLLLTQTDAEGNTTTNTFNGAQRLTTYTDGNGHTQSYDYNAFGFVTGITLEDGAVLTDEISNEGYATARIDGGGNRTEYDLDGLGRLTGIERTDGSIAGVEYDKVGRLTASTDENGNRRRYEYDAAGRMIRVVDAAGHETTYAYDAADRRIAETNAEGHTTRYEYDALGRQIRTIHPDGSTQQRAYDALGRVISQTDELGRMTQFEYDEVGNLLKVIDPALAETVYTYDEVGNRLTQADANGHVTTWTYDDLGRVLTHTQPIGVTESFTYDGNGNVITHTDFNGQLHEFDYDQRDRIVEERFADGNVVIYGYTDTGLIDTVTDSLGVTDYDYDDRDRLTRVTQADGNIVDYTYDSFGNVLTIGTASGITTYTYDALNRIETVTDAQGGVTTYAYDAIGNVLTRTLANDTVTTYEYDSRARVLAITHETSTGGLIESFDYEYDPVGNVTRVDEGNGRSVVYEYDLLDRLIEEHVTKADSSEQVTMYTYDAVGNRLTRDVDGDVTIYTYDDNDRMLSAGSVTFGYDNNGNQTSRTDGGDVTTYTYDSQNRLVRVEQSAGATTYEYDFRGNLVERDSNGEVTRFVLDVNRAHTRMIEERDGSGDLIVRFERGSEFDLLSQTMAGQTHYSHADRLGSTRVLTSEAQSVTDTFVYDAFGTLVDRTGATEVDHLFAGEFFDSSSGLYNLRARNYNPTIGHFMSTDPFMGEADQPGTLHNYTYVQNNPATGTDPSGLFFGSLSDFVVANAILVQSFSMTAATVVTALPTFAATVIFYRPALEMRTQAVEWIIRTSDNLAGLEGATRMLVTSQKMFAVGRRAQGAADELVEFAQAGMGAGEMASKIIVGKAPRAALDLKGKLEDAVPLFTAIVTRITEWLNGDYGGLKSLAMSLVRTISPAIDLTLKVGEGFKYFTSNDDDES